ncbi:MAG: hypothetical protein E7662_03355 [Ruminococcaceae bacterium]|nr:hypothetical protein [Oscillospiraceae bacterium]
MSDFEERMRKKGYGEFLWRMVKGIALSCIVALAIYLILIMLFSGSVKDKGDGGTDTVPMILLQIAYLIAVYAFYIRHEAREFYTPGEYTDAKTILRGYMRDGGWILLLVFGIVAIAAETIQLLSPETIANPIVFVGVLNMPLIGAIPLPIVRAVVGYIVSVGGILAMTVIARQRQK